MNSLEESLRQIPVERIDRKYPAEKEGRFTVRLGFECGCLKFAESEGELTGEIVTFAGKQRGAQKITPETEQRRRSGSVLHGDLQSGIPPPADILMC